MPYFLGDNSANTLIGTVGSDQIFGQGGADTLDGKEGLNFIWGGDGNDTINAGKGRDVIYGESGDDLIKIVGNWSGTFVIGGFGDDTITLDRAGAGTFLSLDYDLRYNLNGADPLDSIDVIIRNGSMTIDKTDSSSNTTQDNVDGMSSLGEDGMIQIFGTMGDDTVDATGRSSGPMISFFAMGEDRFDGSSDAYEELVLGQSTWWNDGSDPYREAFNEITITTSSGGQMNGRVIQTEADGANSTNNTHTIRFTDIDMIEGSSGDDFATGSGGDDKFRPGYGNDGFDGGKGSDTVYYDATGIVSVVVDLQYGYAESLFRTEVAIDDYQGIYGGDRFYYDDQPQYDGLRKVENAVGSDGDDILRGSNKKNILDGGAGDDNLNGRKGNDVLFGGDGNDNLRGFQGRDTFVFDSNDGDDRIFKWEDGKDSITIFDGLSFADVEITDHGRHAQVTFGDTSVLVLNTDHADLGESDFVFI